MFCVVIKDLSGEIIEIYGPFENTNQCLSHVNTMKSENSIGWKFKIFPMYK